MGYLEWVIHSYGKLESCFDFPIPRSQWSQVFQKAMVKTVEDALERAGKIGFPIMVGLVKRRFFTFNGRSTSKVIFYFAPMGDLLLMVHPERTSEWMPE